jgi:hypothetical protein
MPQLSFAKYDSADQPTIEASIEHAATNPFLLSNFQDVLVYRRDDNNVEVCEPRNVLAQFFWMLEPFLEQEPMPEDERFMPERTSKRLYDSHDFWYVVQLANGVTTCTEYDFATIKVLPADKLYLVETILLRAKNQTIAVTDGDEHIIFK